MVHNASFRTRKYGPDPLTDATPPRPIVVINSKYGECETKTVFLKTGWRYEVQLGWIATQLETPDYDYTLTCDAPSGVTGETLGTDRALGSPRL